MRRLTGILGLCIASLAGAAPVLHRYPIPTEGSGASQMGGCCDELWFAEPDANRLARLATNGVIEERTLPTPNSRPFAMARESRSYFGVFFTEPGANKIGWIDASGALTEYAIPTPDSDPRGILATGGIWFTEYAGNRIGEVRGGTSNPVLEYPIPTPDSGPLGIAIGPGSSANNYDFWFTEYLGNKIGRLRYQFPRAITEYPIPTPDSGPTALAQAVVDNEIVLFFTESRANKIGRITAEGVITEYPIPTPESGPTDILATSSGVWFSERLAGKLGHMSFDGEFREYPLPEGSEPAGIGFSYTDLDGRSTPTSIWYVDAANGQIGRLSDNLILAVGAGSVGSWDTEFQVSRVDDLPQRARIGLAPPGVCPGSCPDPGIVVEVPAGGTANVRASEVFTYGATVDTFRITGSSTTDLTDLPAASARIVNRSRPEWSAELPLIDYWSVFDANASVLRFPAARDARSHSNLVIAGVSNLYAIYGDMLTIRVEAIASDGTAIAGLDTTLWTGQTRMLIDVLGMLHLDHFDGEIGVTRLDGFGLIWGLMATIHQDDGLELFAPTISGNAPAQPAAARVLRSRP